MYKGTLENLRVKKAVIEAFFFLLKEKHFSEINVTDIIKKAGIARASYYRNFTSKEDIIEQYIERLEVSYNRLVSEKKGSNHASLKTVTEILECAFQCALDNKSYLLSLYQRGFSSWMQEKLNDFIENALGDMPNGSIDQYRLTFLSGAVFYVEMKWLEKGAKESPYEMAKIFVDMLPPQLFSVT